MKNKASVFFMKHVLCILPFMLSMFTFTAKAMELWHDPHSGWQIYDSVIGKSQIEPLDIQTVFTSKKQAMIRLQSTKSSMKLGSLNDLSSGKISFYYQTNEGNEGVLFSGFGSSARPHLVIRQRKQGKQYLLRVESAAYIDNGWRYSVDEGIINSTCGGHITFLFGKTGRKLYLDNTLIFNNPKHTDPIHQLWKVGIGGIPNSQNKHTLASLQGDYAQVRITTLEDKKNIPQSQKVPSMVEQYIFSQDQTLKIGLDSKNIIREILCADDIPISAGIEVGTVVDGKTDIFRAGKACVFNNSDFSIHTSIDSGPETVTVKAEFTALADKDKPVKLFLRSSFDRKIWPWIISYTDPKRRLPSTQCHRLWYGDAGNDLSLGNTNLGWRGGIPVLPFIALERPDRYIICGELDINRSMTLNSNEAGAFAPAVELNPKTVKKGETFILTLSFGEVKRKYSTYRDFTAAVRWYMNHLTNSNEITKDLIRGDWRQHMLPYPGNLRSYSGIFQKYNKELSDHEWIHQMEAGLDSTRTKYLWLYGWHGADESYPVKGTYYIFRNYRLINVEQARNEIRRLQKKGYKVFLYFRQFAMKELVKPGIKPYPEWLAKSHKGELITYDAGVSFPVPKELQNKIGAEKLTWVHLDFSNKECRQWYIDNVKKAIDFYQPDGIAWDMGWAGGTQLGHGTLRIQADIYKWRDRHRPELMILGNNNGNPSSLYIDGVLLENTQIGSGNKEAKGPLDYASCHAFNTSLSDVNKVYLIDMVAKKLNVNARKLYVELSLRSLALGATIGYPEPYEELAAATDFSAKLMNVPFALEKFKFEPFNEDVDVAGYLGSRCYVTAFNNQFTTRNLKITFPMQELNKLYKKPRLRLCSADANGNVMQKFEYFHEGHLQLNIPGKTLLMLEVVEQ